VCTFVIDADMISLQSCERLSKFIIATKGDRNNVKGKDNISKLTNPKDIISYTGNKIKP
jgi:hypothetical protein